MTKKSNFAAWYRETLKNIPFGGKPPCYHCSDAQIEACSLENKNCHAFNSYVNSGPKATYQYSEAMKILGVSERTFYRLISAGEIQTNRKTNGKKGNRIIAQSVHEYLKKYSKI